MVLSLALLLPLWPFLVVSMSHILPTPTPASSNGPEVLCGSSELYVVLSKINILPGQGSPIHVCNPALSPVLQIPTEQVSK